MGWGTRNEKETSIEQSASRVEYNWHVKVLNRSYSNKYC